MPESLPELSRKRLTDQAVEELRRQIIAGAIPPGALLRQEEVAAALGISRTPLREAIRVLVHDGFLSANKSGTSARVIELSSRDAIELYQIRGPLDALAARLCAQRANNIDFAEIDRNLAILESAVSPFDTETFLTSHAEFHVGLVEACGNLRLRQTLFIVRMSCQMLFSRLKTGQPRMVESAAEHRGILDAVKAGDADRAERLAREHIERASRYWLAEKPPRQP